MGIFGGARTSLDLREQRALLKVELVDPLHGTDIHACTILHIETGLGDDRKTRHLPLLLRLTVIGFASMLGSGRPVRHHGDSRSRRRGQHPKTRSNRAPSSVPPSSLGITWNDSSHESTLVVRGRPLSRDARDTGPPRQVLAGRLAPGSLRSTCEMAAQACAYAATR